MKPTGRISTVIGIAGVALTLVAPIHAQFENVGTIDFPTSSQGEAQEHFLRGVAILHSFGWKQAVEQFRAAQAIDPDFALAYWGETLAYNHPLQPEANSESPREALKRLGATPAERLAKAPTAREKGLIDAVERLWGKGNWRERRVAYMHAMARLHEENPMDDEIATFYALSMLSGARALGDDSLRLEVQAGAIALGVLDRNPNHPGAAHFVIHSFDDPLHAPIALSAAYLFAEIAPAVSHARHMPTHIFIQHGMWDRVSTGNQSAYDAAQDLWEPGDPAGDAVHALDWGQYGDLQRGDHEKARLWIDRLEAIIEASEGQARAVSTLPVTKARYVVETEEWKIDEIADETSAHTLLATGLSAVRTGDLDTARQAEQALARLVAAQDDGGNMRNGQRWVRVMHKEVAALVRAAQGDADGAAGLMDEALEIVAGIRPPNGAANPVKPAYELYGEILLDLGRPDEAVSKFETSLLRMPNRARSVLGLARALERVGDEAGAAEQYQRLNAIWAGRDSFTRLQEARP